MATSATQSGVPNDDTGTNDDNLDQAREPSARELMMESIAGGNDERIRQEAADGGVAIGGADDQIEQQLELPTKQAPRVLSADELVQSRVKVKIDGVEEEVSIEELQRNYQKGGAADRRLAEATRLLTEARAVAVPPVGIDPKAVKNDSPAADPKVKTSERNKKLVEALFEGDQEKALEALEEFDEGRGNATPTLEVLTAQLAPAVQQQLVNDDALARFATDHAHIVGDPHLASMADGFLEEAMEAGTPLPQALEAAAQKTQDWLTSMGIAAPKPKPATSRDRKLERKAGMDTLPTLHKKAAVQEDVEESASDVIASMRAARGMN